MKKKYLVMLFVVLIVSTFCVGCSDTTNVPIGDFERDTSVILAADAAGVVDDEIHTKGGVKEKYVKK